MRVLLAVTLALATAASALAATAKQSDPLDADLPAYADLRSVVVRYSEKRITAELGLRALDRNRTSAAVVVGTPGAQYSMGSLANGTGHRAALFFDGKMNSGPVKCAGLKVRLLRARDTVRVSAPLSCLVSLSGDTEAFGLTEKPGGAADLDETRTFAVSQD